MKDIHECMGDIGSAKSTIFTTFDLTSAFWHMPLHANSVPKTAFTLPGLGQYNWYFLQLVLSDALQVSDD